MIYKSSQPYRVQYQRQEQAMSVGGMNNPYGNSYEYNEVMTTLFPNSTRSHTTGTDQWSQIAPNSFDLSNQYTNTTSSYQQQPPYGTYHPSDYSSPTHTASPPMLIPPPSEPMLQSSSLAFPHSPGSFISQSEDHSGGIRMSIYVEELKKSQHQPVPLETGPFKKFVTVTDCCSS